MSETVRWVPGLMGLCIIFTTTRRGGEASFSLPVGFILVSFSLGRKLYLAGKLSEFRGGGYLT